MNYLQFIVILECLLINRISLIFSSKFYDFYSYEKAQIYINKSVEQGQIELSQLQQESKTIINETSYSNYINQLFTKIQVLALQFYNQGIFYEELNQINLAYESYQLALDIIKSNVGKTNETYKWLKSQYTKFYCYHTFVFLIIFFCLNCIQELENPEEQQPSIETQYYKIFPSMNTDNKTHSQPSKAILNFPKQNGKLILYSNYGNEKVFEKLLSQLLNFDIEANQFEIIDYQYRKEHTKFFKIFIGDSIYCSFSVQNAAVKNYPQLPDNQNIAKFIGIIKEAEYISSLHPVKKNNFNGNCIVINESAFLSLEDLIKIAEHQEIFSEQVILHIISQLLSALITLQSENIAHRDIKPSNILFSSRDSCFKIANFDVAITMDSEYQQTLKLKNSAGSIAYMSPQLFKFYSAEQKNQDQMKNLYYSPYSSDTYSLGLVILTMIGATDEQKIILRKEPEKKMVILKEFGKMYPQVVVLLEQMLGYEEVDRPNYIILQQILNKLAQVNINFEKWGFEILSKNPDHYCKRFTAMDIREQITYLENISDLYQKGQYYENSLKCLHSIAKLQGDMFYGSSEKIVQVFEQIGMNYFISGSFKKAEVFNKLVLMEYPELEWGKELQIMQNLLQIYWQAKESNKFEKLLEKYIQIISNKLNSQEQLNLSLILELGILFLLQKNYSLSQDCFDQCFNDQQPPLPKNDQQNYLEKIITVHLNYQEYENALEYIEMLQNINQEQNNIVILYRKAICLILTGQSLQAEEIFKKLIQLIEEEKNDLEICIYYDYGTFFLSMNKYEEAMNYLAKSQQILEEQYLGIHPLAKQIYQVSLSIKQNYEKYKKFIEEQIQEKNNNNNNPNANKNMIDPNMIIQQVCYSCQQQQFLTENMFYYCQQCNICVCLKCSQSILIEDDDDHKMNLVQKEGENEEYIVVRHQCLSCPQSWEIY